MNQDDRIALFKYGLIAPILNGTKTTHASYFKEIAKKEYEFPPGQGTMQQFKWRTFKKWLHIYRSNGIQGLKPVKRNDKGVSRKVDADIGKEIKQICEEFDFKTVSNLYRYLLKENIISYETFTEVTLRNYLKANNIFFKPCPKKARKSFEAEHINILWTADFMHGPYVRDGKKKVKTYLCAIIDDFSRVIVAARFFKSETSLSLQKTLKQAVLNYAVPIKLYCDNGKVFVSGYIHMVCARLGIALIHSKPYDSPSRGKIVMRSHRYFILYLLNIQDFFSCFLFFLLLRFLSLKVDDISLLPL